MMFLFFGWKILNAQRWLLHIISYKRQIFGRTTLIVSELITLYMYSVS